MSAGESGSDELPQVDPELRTPGAIAKAGTYIITVKCEGESLPESQRAHLIVGFRQ